MLQAFIPGGLQHVRQSHPAAAAAVTASPASALTVSHRRYLADRMAELSWSASKRLWRALQVRMLRQISSRLPDTAAAVYMMGICCSNEWEMVRGVGQNADLAPTLTAANSSKILDFTTALHAIRLAVLLALSCSPCARRP